MSSIKFGTDGWRGVIAEDFTFANARIVAHAIALYVVRNEDARKGVLIGYDHRYAADRVAAAVSGADRPTRTSGGRARTNLPPPTHYLLLGDTRRARDADSTVTPPSAC